MAEDEDLRCNAPDYDGYNHKLSIVVDLWSGITNAPTSRYADFAVFIGDPCPEPVDGVEMRSFIVDLTKEWVRDLVDAFSGPHGETMMKAFIARREAKDA